MTRKIPRLVSIRASSLFLIVTSWLWLFGECPLPISLGWIRRHSGRYFLELSVIYSELDSVDVSAAAHQPALRHVLPSACELVQGVNPRTVIALAGPRARITHHSKLKADLLDTGFAEFVTRNKGKVGFHAVSFRHPMQLQWFGIGVSLNHLILPSSSSLTRVPMTLRR